MTNSTLHRRPLRRAFTLIEILVVVGIIVLLIAILIPALGRGKSLAYRAQTESMMTHLSTAIESYYQLFQAYPGPASALDTAGTATAKKLSGSQNLLLGMTFAMTDNSANSPNGPNFTNIPGSTFNADPTQPNGPINRATIRPDGKPEQLSPFFEVTTKNISKANQGTPNKWPVAGVQGAASNSFAFPVLVDAFPDGLPILYYRRTPGVDKPAPVSQVAGTSFQSGPFAYYYSDNQEYTTSPTGLIATSGVKCPQNTGSMFNSGSGVAELSNLVQNGTGTAATARGGYILISAGVDRIYGSVTSGNVTASDDIVRVGGN